MKRAFAAAMLGSALLIPNQASAWDGAKSGKITGVDVVADGENFGFRVYIAGPPMCGTSQYWAYINRSNQNYDAIVAVLTSAYYSGKDVTLYTTKRAGEYCEIGYIQVK